MVEVVTIKRILPTSVWIEDDLFGARHVMLQHEGMEPFCFASFHYDYAYTSNSGTWAAAHALAVHLGASEPVEHRVRALGVLGSGSAKNYTTADGVRSPIPTEQLHAMRSEVRASDECRDEHWFILFARAIERAHGVEGTSADQSKGGA